MKGYTFKDYDKEHMARALGVALPISFKHSVEICSYVKNRNVNDAKRLLNEVADMKKAIPFRRFDSDLAHKRKMGPGRYPIKASTEIRRLLESAESNAQFKGLNTSNLIIAHISAHKAGKAWHYGRKSRRKMKRTNIEICVQERAKKSEEKKESPHKKTEVKK